MVGGGSRSERPLQENLQGYQAGNEEAWPKEQKGMTKPNGGGGGGSGSSRVSSDGDGLEERAAVLGETSVQEAQH